PTATCISMTSPWSQANNGWRDVRESCMHAANAGTPVRSDDSGIDQCRTDCAGCRSSFVLRRTQASRLPWRARDKFASIIGAARGGNFLDSKVSLPGWGDCSFYGMRTYTCDSEGFKTADEGNAAHGRSSRRSNLVFAAAGPRMKVEARPDM